MLVVLTGGARSGKSTAALALARARSGAVTFIATATPGDQEMSDRIAAHQAERPTAWGLIEEPNDPAHALRAVPSADTAIIDCITIWVANRLGDDDAQILSAAAEIARAAADRQGLTVVVTNEVGFGIVPADAITRRYRDLLGAVNQRLVREADRAALIVAGRAIDLTPEPWTTLLGRLDV